LVNFIIDKASGLIAHLFTNKTEKIHIRSREHLDLDLDKQPALQQPLDTLQEPWTLNRSPWTFYRSPWTLYRSPWTLYRNPWTLYSSPSRGERFLGSIYGCMVLVFVRIHFCSQFL
jgi:hypothetical protein